jgi:hypothetical protein
MADRLNESELRRQALFLERNLGDEIRQHTLNHSTERNESFKDIGAIQMEGGMAPTRMRIKETSQPKNY